MSLLYSEDYLLQCSIEFKQFRKRRNLLQKKWTELISKREWENASIIRTELDAVNNKYEGFHEGLVYIKVYSSKPNSIFSEVGYNKTN